MQCEKNKEMRSEHSYVSNAVNLRSGQMLHTHTHTSKRLHSWVNEYNLASGPPELHLSGKTLIDLPLTW